jgi:site-specific DNA recombinase
VADAHIYREVASGFSLDRPKLSDLRAALRRGEIEVIIVNSFDRWASEQPGLYRLYAELSEAEALLTSVTQGDFVDSAIGRAVVSMYTTGRELWLEDHKERTQRGRRKRVESGKPLAGLKALYGYRWLYEPNSKGVPVKTALEVYEPEATIVRRIFHHLAKGGTATELCHRLTLEGVPTPSTNKHGEPGIWCASTIGRIVREDGYIGIAWANKYSVSKKGGKRTVTRLPEQERTRVPGNPIPAIVDSETAERAKAQLVSNRRRPPAHALDPDAFLLRGGFARCGICGSALTASHRNDGKPPVYRCPAAYKLTHMGKHQGVCIYTKDLDRDVWEYVKLVRTNRDYVRQHLERQAAEAGNTGELESLDKALRKLAGEESSLLASIRMAQSSEAIALLTGEVDKLAKVKKGLQAERQDALERAAAFDRARDALETFEAAVEADIEALDRMPMSQRRDVLSLFGVSVKVWPAKGDYEQRHAIDMAFDLSAWLDPAFFTEQSDGSDEATASGLVPAPTYRVWPAKPCAEPVHTDSDRRRSPPWPRS